MGKTQITAEPGMPQVIVTRDHDSFDGGQQLAGRLVRGRELLGCLFAGLVEYRAHHSQGLAGDGEAGGEDQVAAGLVGRAGLDADHSVGAEQAVVVVHDTGDRQCRGLQCDGVGERGHPQRVFGEHRLVGGGADRARGEAARVGVVGGNQPECGGPGVHLGHEPVDCAGVQLARIWATLFADGSISACRACRWVSRSPATTGTSD